MGRQGTGSVGVWGILPLAWGFNQKMKDMSLLEVGTQVPAALTSPVGASFSGDWDFSPLRASEESWWYRCAHKSYLLFLQPSLEKSTFGG